MTDKELIEMDRDWETNKDLARSQNFLRWLIVCFASGIFVVVCVLASESGDIFYWFGALACSALLAWLIARVIFTARSL